MQDQKEVKLLTKRVPWIDICRGIAILFVLYGHILTADKQHYLIYAFHMPLFFFLSGIVFKPIMTKPFSFIIKKNVKQLLIPYFIFAILTYFFAIASHTTGTSNLGGVIWQLFGMVYGNGNNGMLGYNVVLWFLPCLFITKVTFAFVSRKISRIKPLMLFLFGSALSGYVLSIFFPWVKLPFGFESALTGIVFFGCGYLWKQRAFVLARSKKYKIPVAITTMIFTLIVATIQFRATGYAIDLRTNHLGNFFLFYLAAFGGIISCITISQILAKNFFLEYLGSHSMVLFAWHNILFVDLKNFTQTFVARNFVSTITVLMPTLYVFTAMTIILLSRMMVIKLKEIYPLR